MLKDRKKNYIFMIITKPIRPFDLLGCTGFFICFDENFKIEGVLI